ncbi:hypothetical protein PENSPDRAFT_688133 [Peniophora sp. CONT]|nr:hypothetical protein PENSPDRAFT_688133 [Peniophora sp. CONT]
MTSVADDGRSLQALSWLDIPTDFYAVKMNEPLRRQQGIHGKRRRDSWPSLIFTQELDPYHRLINLAYDQLQRYERLSHLDDLNLAIVLYRHGLRLLSKDHPDRPYCLSCLGDCLYRLFSRLGEAKCIESSISAYRDSVELTLDGHPELPQRLSNLSLSLSSRFSRFGEPNDIESALDAACRAVALTPDEDPRLPDRLDTLAFSLWARFNRFGEPRDIESALTASRRAVALTADDDPKLPEQLDTLALSLWARFDRFGEPSDIESSIDAGRRAVALTAYGDPELPQRLSNLALSLWARFTQSGKPDDIEDALDASRRAVSLALDDNPHLAEALNMLALSWWARFNRFGQPGDIESAIDAGRRAVALTPDDNPQLPEELNVLALSLWARFTRFGEPSDIESAIEAGRRAVKLTFDDDSQLPQRLSNLAVSFWDRFIRFDEPNDIESALDAGRCAVALTPDDDPQLPDRLDTLAITLLNHYICFGDPSDIESAIVTGHRAVALTADEDPEFPRRLSNLALSLLTRFERFGAACDLESAVQANLRAVELAPEGHPDNLRRMYNLGCCLDFYRFTHDSTQKNFDEVVGYYLAALDQPIGHPYWRFQSAEAYVRIVTDHPEFRAPNSLLLAHSHVMNSVSEFVWLGHSIQRRFEESARVGGLVNAAVCVAIESGDLARAVGWLEAGRSLIWSQVASMRTPLDDLAEKHPDLASDLQVIHLELQQLGVASRPNTAFTANQDIAPAGLPVRSDAYGESAADRHRRVAINHDALLKDIRSHDGFENFMRPKELASFIGSPMFTRLDGTVVFINVAESSCDALILFSSGTVTRVKLPELSQRRAEKLRILWTENVGLRRANRRGVTPWEFGPVRGYSNVYTLVLGRLWTWAVHPVLEALNFIKEDAGKALPHVIWCPTGPVTQLPLHAAGLYEHAQPSSHISNFVVSSYTPSLSALLRCLEKNNEQRASPRMLLVAQTNTPRYGFTALPHVRDESARVRALLHGDEHTFLEDEQAKVNSVLAAINQHTWVHFACHGSQNPTDPTLTSVELYDKPLTLTDLMRTVSDNAELAFLSACETAVGDKKIPEESAHLAAGMLAVGFKGVVATMWSIHDEDGPVIVEAYYKKLLELRATGTVPRGHTGAAYALHHAVEVLRKEVGENKFERWVPFVHFGV